MLRLPVTLSSPVLSIAATGFTATIAQIIILRELLVLFYGNELSAGLIFAAWLLWSGLGSGIAAKWVKKTTSLETIQRLVLVCMALVLPVCILFIRASRILWTLPPGELPSIGKMLLISFAATGLFCPVSGALFAICWKLHRETARRPSMGIYLSEALGSAIGGLVFYFMLMPNLSGFAAIWLSGGVMLFLAGWLFRPWWPISNLNPAHFIWLIALILFLSGTFSSIHLEQMSRRWQWGPNLVATHDTAFHNIAALKKDSQVSIFTNGLWSFSEPDILSAEHNVHLALLQHPDPKTILILGSGIAGLLDEIFKHPGIQQVDYVEPDPDFIRLIQPHLAPATMATLQNTQVKLIHRDPRSFLLRSNSQYDVILMQMGDPITAQMNRFYTQDFYTHVKKCLSPGGVFSFAVSGGESMLGPTQARYVSSLKLTLLQIFPRVMIYPGDQIRFFATDLTRNLVSDPMVLTQRIANRNLSLTYIREDILQDALNPMRLNYMETILKDVSGAAINKDFSPICYFHTLAMWATQWHKTLQKFFNSLVGLEVHWLWTIVVCAAMLIIVFFWTGQPKFKLAVSSSIFISGAIEIVIQVILLLSFQIIQGYMYRQIALIIAFFMAGLAVGAGWVSRYRPANAAAHVAWKRLLRIQSLICILPLGLIFLLSLFHTDIQNLLTPSVMLWLFAGLSLVTGILGGLHFALATMVMAGVGVVFEKIGGYFYALDVAGAAVGALMAALFILPIYGIMNTLICLSLLASVSLVALLRRT